jgi:hypothetical protein
MLLVSHHIPFSSTVSGTHLRYFKGCFCENDVTTAQFGSAIDHADPNLDIAEL